MTKLLYDLSEMIANGQCKLINNPKFENGMLKLDAS